MPPHRKVPFSNKQKKEQLRAKRERKQKTRQNDEALKDTESVASVNDELSVRQINQQPTNKQLDDCNRYRLHFQNDSKEDVERGKRLSRQTLSTVSKERLEVSLDDVYPESVNLDIPKRPPWNYSMSCAEVERREDKYFRDYTENLFKVLGGSRKLSYVESNLETWQQLWRVLEMSDIVLIIADIRFPMIHFCPALYRHVNELKKHVVLVLNKVDVAPVELVTAWKSYFTEKYPQLHIVCFTSHPRDVCAVGSDPGSALQKRKRAVKTRSAVGPRQLLETCEQITSGAVDLSSWRTKIADDSTGGGGVAAEDCEIDTVETVSGVWPLQPQQQQPYDGGVLTIGCCGYPNVGKSSLINGLMGKKVVSVSRTPGHTKHFQTIFLTSTVRLCDSPGLVFPSAVARPLQVLAGIYPIAQLREPYSAVRYLAERLPVVDLLALRHPDGSSDTGAEWSAFDVCEAWALKRGFLTAKAARPDVYRAANNILRLALEGRLCLCLRPPHFTSRHDEWRTHEDTAELSSLLRASEDQTEEPHEMENSDDDETGSSDRGEEAECSDEAADDDDDVVPFTTLSSTNPFELLADDG